VSWRCWGCGAPIRLALFQAECQHTQRVRDTTFPVWSGRLQSGRGWCWIGCWTVVCHHETFSASRDALRRARAGAAGIGFCPRATGPARTRRWKLAGRARSPPSASSPISLQAFLESRVRRVSPSRHHNRTPIETRVPLNISTALRGENPWMVEECSKKRQRPPWSGAFQFLAPLAWRLCGSSTNQHSFRQKVSQPYRPSSLAGSPNWPVCWNGRQSSQHLASTAQRFCPPLRTAIVPRLRVLPQLEHTNAPTFPCVTAFPARAPNARASPRGDSIPLERRLPPSLASHSGGKPPHPTRCRDRERRPRTVAAFGVRPSCWRCRGAGPRLGSYCPAPVFLARSTPAPVRLPTRQHFPSDSRVLSRPGVGTPEQAVSA